MKRLFLSIAVLASSTLAWDGQRQGFLLGIGGGAASASLTRDDTDEGDAESVQGYVPATVGRIGYAWTNTESILLYTSNTQTGGMVGYIGANYQRWNSADVNANSWFGGAGLLMQNSGITYDGIGPRPANTGFGINFGYAREIAAHASIELGLVVGKYEDKGYYIDADESWEESDESTDVTYAAFTVTFSLLG